MKLLKTDAERALKSARMDVEEKEIRLRSAEYNLSRARAYLAFLEQHEDEEEVKP